MARVRARVRAAVKRGSRSKSSTSSKSDTNKVITGKCRSSFMRVLQLEEDRNGNRACQTAILIRKKDKKTLRALRGAIEFASERRFGDKVNIFKSKKMNQPLHDGDELAEDPESAVGKEARGCYVLNTKSYKLPGVVDKHNVRITDRDELEDICISGYYFHFSLTFKSYDNETKGVRVELNNLMFIAEGERLDGGKTAEEDFEEFAEEDDDDDDDDD